MARLFRGMLSAADSERAQKSGRIHLGISGRVPSEWVADLRRNQWPAWVGIRSRCSLAVDRRHPRAAFSAHLPRCLYRRE